ncbi:MAG: AAA family ATPase [Candidatus Brocadiia bacterium]
MGNDETEKQAKQHAQPVQQKAQRVQRKSQEPEEEEKDEDEGQSPQVAKTGKKSQSPQPKAQPKSASQKQGPAQDSQAKTGEKSSKQEAGERGAREKRKKPYRSEKDAELVEKLGAVRQTLVKEIQKVIVGQSQVIEELLIAMFCRAHVLMVGVPGLAKTLLVRTIADTMDLNFKRIQFTPDLMPSDITGTEILEIDPETQERRFKFQPGPIFTNILLADEINRTPPKTQAALLECMQEYRVTAAGQTYDIQKPFFVLATQNPIEQEGTYPLPEAQLDRFMFMIMVDYPKRNEEIEIMRRTTVQEMPEASQVMEGSEILKVQDIVRRVPVSDHILEYVADLVRATRPASEDAPQFIKDWIEWGAGPRAAQYLILGAKAHAVIGGRFNVSCADVRAIAHPIMRHRIMTNFAADSEDVTVEDVIDKLLENIPEPDEEAYARRAQGKKEGSGSRRNAARTSKKKAARKKDKIQAKQES